MANDGLTKIKWGIGTILTIIGGIIGILEGYDTLKDRIDANIKVKVIEHSEPLIKKQISFTLDSIAKAKKMSFREGLATEFGVEKRDIIPLIGDWYKSEKDISTIGFKWNDVTQELYYLGTDLKRYRPFRDSLGHFFYYDSNNKRVPCF